jgi:hypothetical protein
LPVVAVIKIEVVELGEQGANAIRPYGRFCQAVQERLLCRLAIARLLATTVGKKAAFLPLAKGRPRQSRGEGFSLLAVASKIEVEEWQKHGARSASGGCPYSCEKPLLTPRSDKSTKIGRYPRNNLLYNASRFFCGA